MSRGAAAAIAACTVAALLVAAPAGAPRAAPEHKPEPRPGRVMSLNICTDQLAMLLAGPGQLVSVSFLSGDPSLSVLHERAGAYPQNHGLAEEVFLAEPDLVLTGTYSLHNTTALLRGAGVRVEEFPFTQTLDTIPDDIRRMGRLLGREAAAEALARSFSSELARVESARCAMRPTAIAWDQNGVALGAGTLADSAMRAAGLRNLAAELGYAGMTPLPLELLVVHRPDIVILPERLVPAPSLADQALAHPALRALQGSLAGRFVPAGAWTCGGPSTIEAVKALATLRERVAPCAEAPS